MRNSVLQENYSLDIFILKTTIFNINMHLKKIFNLITDFRNRTSFYSLKGIIEWDKSYATDKERVLALEQNKKSGIPLLLDYS